MLSRRALGHVIMVGLMLGLPASAGLAQGAPQCAPDNAGLTLPDGFCAIVYADLDGRARHLAVASNGDVFVAVGPTREQRDAGGVVVLWDSNGDGVADGRERFGSGNGDDVEFHGEYLYFSTNSAVMRYRWREGARSPAGAPDTVVRDLPAYASHRAKSIAFGADGALYVNIGAPSNACQQEPRTRESAGKDPCDQLETRGGIWRFDADRSGQTQRDGRRFATGLRNTVALTVRAQDGRVYGVQHGRDQLSELWPEHFTNDQRAELPAEEFVRIEDGDDFGWPYCYYDAERELKVLAPEYGGDGAAVGRCSEKKGPLLALPAHWAPNGIHFYVGGQFPARYRGGAFIAFHGSWNRAPAPQGGYNVVFAPFDGDEPTGEWEVFADGFAGADVSPRGSAHRPVGIAEGPDGALYVSDDRGNRIFRIVYVGH